MKAFPAQPRIARFGTLLPAAIALTLAAEGAAQPQPVPAEPVANPIVVRGERLSRAAVEERAAGFIRATGVASGETPAARWVDPVCPAVTGLLESAERFAVARIRRIAEAAGVPVAPEPCVRNIVVSFTPDGAGLARAISRREPRRTAELPRAARDEILTGAAPIRWLYTTELRGRDGRQQTMGTGGEAQPMGSDSGAGSAAASGGLMQFDSSIVSTLSQRVITSAIVIVDQDEVMGRRLDSLADYAALVALAEIRAPDASPAGSILGMFAAPEPAPSLTAQDTAFLRALYRMPLDREARQHRGVLVSQVADALTAGNP